MEFENVVLFLQHGLLYQEFSNAIHFDDPGRVEHCLKIFSIWFQSPSNSSGLYTSELLHMELWSEEFREFWRDNCLVNTSGSPKGFMPCDQLGEYVVREIKGLIQHNHTAANDEYLQHVLTRLVMDLLDVHRNTMNAINATNYYQHSSNVQSI